MDEIEELVKKGKTLMDDGKFDDALGFFEHPGSKEGHDPDLWNNKGVALRSLGRYEESMDCFNKSLEIEPRDKLAS